MRGRLATAASRGSSGVTIRGKVRNSVINNLTVAIGRGSIRFISNRRDDLQLPALNAGCCSDGMVVVSRCAAMLAGRQLTVEGQAFAWLRSMHLFQGSDALSDQKRICCSLILLEMIGEAIVTSDPERRQRALHHLRWRRATGTMSVDRLYLSPINTQHPSRHIIWDSDLFFLTAISFARHAHQNFQLELDLDLDLDPSSLVTSTAAGLTTAQIRV